MINFVFEANKTFGLFSLLDFMMDILLLTLIVDFVGTRLNATKEG